VSIVARACDSTVQFVPAVGSAGCRRGRLRRPRRRDEGTHPMIRLSTIAPVLQTSEIVD